MTVTASTALTVLRLVFAVSALVAGPVALIAGSQCGLTVMTVLVAAALVTWFFELLTEG